MTTAIPAAGEAVRRPDRCPVFVDDQEARVFARELVRTYPAAAEQVVARLGIYQTDRERVVRALAVVATGLQRQINGALAFQEELEETFAELTGAVGREIKIAEDHVADLFGALSDESA